LALLTAVGGIVALILAWRMNALPGSWFVGFALAAVVMIAAVGTGLWLTKAPPHWLRFTALVVVALIGIAAEAATIKITTDVNQFFSQTEPILPTQDYAVVALPQHDPKADSLTGETIGLLDSEPNKAAVEEHLSSKFDAEFSSCADPTALRTELENGRIAAAVLDSNLYEAYLEADPEFYTSLQVIYTFDIQAGSIAKPVPPRAELPPGQPFIVYISGIDTSGPVSRVSRSDVNMLMVVNPDTAKVLLVNTPRDYYVQLHGTTGTKDKLTHAGIYGVQMSIDTLQDLYGINIDYYARVNFSSLIKMVDLVGGIDVDSPQAFTSYHGKFDFVQGMNHMNGEQALGFARERYAFTSGDRMRGKNQQLVIEGLIDKASDRSNLLRYSELLDALADAMEMNVPQDQVTNLVKQRLADGKSWDVQSVSVDGAGSSQPTYSMGAMKLYVMIPDQATIDAAKAQIDQTLSGP
jgi:LCP family protein required for cell wall assembly